MDKKILKQKVNTSDGGNSLKFQFKFRYFPENVADEVIQDVTLRLLFKQVFSSIYVSYIFDKFCIKRQMNCHIGIS